MFGKNVDSDEDGSARMRSNPMIDRSEARRWRRGFLAWGSLAVVVALAIGWTIVWFAASSMAQSRLDGWLEKEAARGRVWSCPERRVEGFPSSFYVVCERPTFSGAVDGTEAQARLTRLSAGAFLWAPGHVDVELVGPLALATKDEKSRLALAFRRMRLDLRFSMEKLQRAALLGEELEIRWTDPNAAFDGKARSVELSAQPVENALQTYDIAVKGAGLAFPELDRFVESTEPASLLIDARLSGAASLAAGRGAERLERWRVARGRLFVERLAFGKGALELTGSGELGLDELHRLEGRVELGERGADALLLRLGVSPAAIGVANALSGLLRGADAGRPTVKLPFSLENGKVAIGPLRKVYRLKPLY
ncbi:MAG: hypothetical protein C3F11_07775 [Methylocystaceae bacterium]|nr:MAG: hypothetical protein C3F11_07775 [Methylocystaceae bacterium]